MLFWSLAIAVTAIACAALYYAAAGRTVNAGAAAVVSPTEQIFRLRLKEIGEDLAAGRLAPREAEAARSELAREYMRSTAEAAPEPAAQGFGGALVPLALVAVAGLAFASYAALGSPQLPTQPLASRPEAAAATLDLDAAIARIERQLQLTPDDVRGWTVIGPAYMQLGRYADAEHAFRQVLALSAPTADAETNLAEALLMQNGGSLTGEPLQLLESAAARDPQHVRSRFYLASEATRSGDFATAKTRWTELLALGKGDEPWVAVAREGLAAAEAGVSGAAAPPPPDAQAIRGMVEALDARLSAAGGTLAEWTQLVRSRLVLGEKERAAAAYAAAVRAYPDASARAELDAIAAQNGLATSGKTP